MLRLEDVTLVAGAKTLLEGASMHVRPGDRVGLVGRNGTGKTTTLRLLAGELTPESGHVHRRGGVRVGFLPQHAVSGSTASVWDEARTGMTRIHALADAMHAAERAVEAGETGAIERLDAAQERFRMAGGFAADERVGEVLHGLGFGPDAWVRPCDTFSGGWQMRIALARLLLSEPDLMLLDEPTNHLDMTSRSWLARHLSRLDATIVIVSHDRHLLDAVCNRTVEIRRRRLDDFSGPLSAWLAERVRRDALAEVTRERQEAEIARLEGFIERFGAKATKATQAQARRKAIDRIELVEAPEREGSPRLVLPPSPPSSEEVIELRGAAFGWDETPVLSGVDLLVLRGQRWAVLGPNGAGKSTLLHALAGRRPLLAGRRTVGRDVRVAVFDQDLVRALPAEVTALDHVLTAAPAVTPQRARSALGALGLHGDAALRPIGALSGGEKARVVLAALAVRPTNLLLLDEPTNHLDAVTVDVVAEALAAWEGAMILVTHDRWLVERLATHVAIVRDGGIETSHGVRAEHLEPISVSRQATPERAEVAAREVDRKERKRQQRRLEKLHGEADEVSASIDAIDTALYDCGDDHDRAVALSAERASAEARLEALFDELGDLEAALSET